MHILLRELKANRRSLIIWTVSLALLNIFMMALYPAFAEDAGQMEEYMEMFPEGFMKIFGLDKLSMADPLGFYAIEAYFMVILFGSIFAAMLASTMLSKEEEEKTIEFLLAKPVSRSRIVAEKLLSILAILSLFTAVIALVTFASFELIVDSYPRLLLARLLVAPLIAQLAFAGVAFLLSLFFTRKKSAYAAGIGLVLGLYFMHVLANLTEKAGFLRYLSPFWYMDAADIIVNNALLPGRTLIMLVVTGVSAVSAWYLYQRRDITF